MQLGNRVAGIVANDGATPQLLGHPEEDFVLNVTLIFPERPLSPVVQSVEHLNEPRRIPIFRRRHLEMRRDGKEERTRRVRPTPSASGLGGRKSGMDARHGGGTPRNWQGPQALRRQQRPKKRALQEATNQRAPRGRASETAQNPMSRERTPLKIQTSQSRRWGTAPRHGGRPKTTKARPRTEP